MNPGYHEGVNRHWIDAHCHLADPRLDPEREEVIRRARQAGITRFIQGGVGPDDWQRQLDIGDRHRKEAEIHPVFGLHPVWVAMHTDEECQSAFEELRGRASQMRALGELGLDHRTRVDGRELPVGHAERQARWFRRQLELRECSSLPRVLHIVRAHGESLRILREGPSSPAGGIVHAFNGDWSVAKQYLDLGFSLSFGGRLAQPGTFEKLRRTVINTPPERLVFESDCPDQSPPGFEGRLNEPVSILEVAQAAARHRGEPAELLLERSRENLERIFRLEPRDA
jgi:TatD DNase family protein